MDIVLASGTVLIAFSLLSYLFAHNVGHPTARAFVAVLSFITVVYVGDVFLSTAQLPAYHPAATFWLRFEWLGIAFVAPAYLHFSDRLLVTTGDESPRRRKAVGVAFALGALALSNVVSGRAIVGGVVGSPGAIHLASGPAFPLFAAGYIGITAWAVRNVWLARQRALTVRSRRRLTYLLVSVAAPLSTFPYLVGGGGAVAFSPVVFRALVAAANLVTASMLVVVAYGVAFQGALMPERMVKRELVKFLIQVPTLGVWVIFLTQFVPERLEGHLGLPRDVIVSLTLVGGIVAFRFMTSAAKPLVDWAIFGRGGGDAMWLRRLDERWLTESDLTQLLENILTALCDRLRVTSGFVVVMRRGRLEVDAYAGPTPRAAEFLASLTPAALDTVVSAPGFVTIPPFRIRALKPPGGGATLGLLAFGDPGRGLAPEEHRAVNELVAATERALEDRLVQGRVIAALRDLEPELEGIQRLRGALEPGGPGNAIAVLEASPIFAADFPNWVKEALSDYWGGPRLTDSPLLKLNIARRALAATEGNPAKAMRQLLDDALERLRPEGERSMTAYEWLAYNILELKFVKGLRVRDIAGRLAMSESDLYRKQRVAIEALAHQLAAMEADPESPPRAGAALPRGRPGR